MEARMLTEAVQPLKELEKVTGQITEATSRWQNAQAEADKTALAARGIADRMTAEAKGFMEFMQRVNDSEKAALRLEVEKLRRAEGDWLQVLVRTLDHIHAVHQGALLSGQPNLIEQLTQFQNACHDAARRVGLIPFVALPEDPFDRERHQVPEGAIKPNAGTAVAGTIAPGFTYQGRLLRPALVQVPNEGGAEPEVASAEQLSLGRSG
jgi:molecular chaperone GrpE (heat shock protein)